MTGAVAVAVLAVAGVRVELESSDEVNDTVDDDDADVSAGDVAVLLGRRCCDGRALSVLLMAAAPAAVATSNDAGGIREATSDPGCLPAPNEACAGSLSDVVSARTPYLDGLRLSVSFRERLAIDGIVWASDVRTGLRSFYQSSLRVVQVKCTLYDRGRERMSWR